VRGACRGKDQKLHSSRIHRVQQIQAAQNVCLVIQFRMLNGFTNERPAGEMQDSCNGIFREHPREVCRLAKISFECGGTSNKGAMTCGEIIKDERLESRSLQCF